DRFPSLLPPLPVPDSSSTLAEGAENALVTHLLAEKLQLPTYDKRTVRRRRSEEPFQPIQIGNLAATQPEHIGATTAGEPGASAESCEVPCAGASPGLLYGDNSYAPRQVFTAQEPAIEPFKRLVHPPPMAEQGFANIPAIIPAPCLLHSFLASRCCGED